MSGVFVYWDNSNMFHEIQRIADLKDGTPGARYLVRIHFDNLLRLACADRPLTRAYAAGAIPPELNQLWNRLENRGVEVNLCDKSGRERGEQDIPDRWLQLRMLEDAADYNGSPGIVALLTGDGAGYVEDRGFHRTLERMHRRGWRVEVLSWVHSCRRGMRVWAEQNGVFVPLDDYYDAITFREPSNPGHEFALRRDETELDLSRRPMA